MTDIKNIIENAWDNVSSLTSENKDIAEAVREVIVKLDNGEYRIAEKNGNEWIVNQWLKKAVLISFRLNDNQIL